MKLNKFGLPEDVFDKIIETLRKFPEIKSAKIFGSRAKGNYKRYSDIDIAVFAEEGRLSAAEVKEALEGLDVIYFIDVLHYENTEDADIKAHIDRVGVEILLN